MTTRAAIYTRISDDREGQAMGVARQEEDCRALAARLGLLVVEVYSDNDISASTRSRILRPGYRRLLTDAAAGEFDVIIAASSSRITRKPREFEDLIELAERYRVRIEYDKSPRFDLNSADGRMMARWMSAADAGEAERTGERIKRKLDDRKAKGLPHGGQRPFGWEMDRVTIREAEAQTIRWGVRQTLAGVPIRTQFRDLNERGVTNSRGGAWTHGTYRGVITTARHAGLMRDGSPAAWPQIITPEQYRGVRRLLDDPARVTTPGRAGKLHLLSGIARCGICGGPLRVGKSRNDSILRCYPSGEVQRNRDHVEEFVLQVIAERLRHPDAVRLLADDDEAEHTARAAAEAEAERLRLLIDETADEHARAGLSIRALAAYLAPLQAQLAAAEEAATPPRDRSAVLGDVVSADDRGAAFLALSVDRQRAVISLLIEIKVNRGPRGNVFRPDGIEITWR